MFSPGKHGCGKCATVAGLIVAATVTSACAVDPGAAGGSAGDTLAARVSAAPASETGSVSRPHPMDSTSKTQRPGEPAELAVTGIRVDSHNGFDRVAVDLHGAGQAGWFADYVSTPMQETSGHPLKVAGNAFLNLNIDGTVSLLEAGLDPELALDVSDSSSNVVDIVNAGTHEGRSQIVIGLRSAVPYSIHVADDPTQLVLDIAKD